VEVKVGRIVVIKVENITPTQWPLHHITKLHPGKNGFTRVVSLKTSTAKNVIRPVAKITLLPFPTEPLTSTELFEACSMYF
jgi:hypothetical protein